MDPALIAEVLELDGDDLLDILETLSPTQQSELLAALPPDTSAGSRYDDPLELASALDPQYRTRPHLSHLSDVLSAATAAVEEGRSQWIQVSMPPRSGKSVLASTWLPTWLLHRHPSWKIGLISHSPTLSTGWGRQVRRTIESFGSRIGVEIARDAGAVADWQTTQAGEIRSRSIGQATTGLGFKVLLLDDIVRDFAAAHSEAQRDAVWDWWTANSRTRLEPPSLTVAIGTRWHEDDFIGRLLSHDHEGNPADWQQISFPAIAEDDDVLGREPGDPLLSPMIDETADQALARWADIRESVGSYAWEALYQQRPAPARGAIFDVGWWKFYDPEDLPTEWDRVLTSWDMAFKDTANSDYVVGQRWGVKGADRYLLDQVRGRHSFTSTVRVVRDFASAEVIGWGPVTEHLVEDKANGPAVIDALKAKIPGVVPINPTNSKEARARAVTPQIEAGNVHLPAGAPWLTEFLSEFRSFPTGKHDDQVDAATQALSRIRPDSKPAAVSGLSRRRSLGGW